MSDWVLLWAFKESGLKAAPRTPEEWLTLTRALGDVANRLSEVRAKFENRERRKGRPRKPTLGAATVPLSGLRTRGRKASEKARGAQEIDDAGALAIAVAIVLRDTTEDLLSFPTRTRAAELAALRIYGMSEATPFAKAIRSAAPEETAEREVLKLQARLAKKLHSDYALEKDAAGFPKLHPDIFDRAGLGQGIIGHPLMKLPAEERRKLHDGVIDMLVKAERKRLGLV